MTDAQPRILVVGEALIDVVPDAGGTPRDLPGGSPANVALTLGRLERDVRLVTLLGDDARGALVRTWLEASNVTVLAQPTGSGRTSSAEVTLDASGAASYVFDLDWDLPAVPDEYCDVLHVGSIATVLDPGADAVLDAVRTHRGRALVSLDPNARPAITPDRTGPVARVEELVALVRPGQGQRRGPRLAAPGRTTPSTPPRAGRRRARDWWWSPAAATAPSPYATTAPRSRCPASRSRVADTVGAGDTFSGVLVDALHRPRCPRRRRGAARCARCRTATCWAS